MRLTMVGLTLSSRTQFTTRVLPNPNDCENILPSGNVEMKHTDETCRMVDAQISAQDKNMVHPTSQESYCLINHYSATRQCPF